MRTTQASCLALLGLGFVTACTSPPPPNANVARIVAIPDEAQVGGSVQLLVDLAPGVDSAGLVTALGTPLGKANVSGPGALPPPLVGNVDVYEQGDGFVRIALSGLPATPAIEDDEPLGGCPPYVPLLPYFFSTQLAGAADLIYFSVIAAPMITTAITAPGEGEEVQETITVNVATTGDVQIVDFYLNGEFVGADADSADGFSLSLDTRALENGTALVTAMGRTSALGLEEVATSSVHVAIDNEEPGGVIDNFGPSPFFSAPFGAPGALAQAAARADEPIAAPKGVGGGAFFQARYGTTLIHLENGVPYVDLPPLAEEDVPDPVIPISRKLAPRAATGGQFTRAGSYTVSSFTVPAGSPVALASCDEPLDIVANGKVKILDEIACNGGDLPSISITATDDIVIRADLSVKGDGANGGSIQLVSTSAHAKIEVYGDLSAEGTASGGNITLVAENGVRIVGSDVSAASPTGAGGQITVRTTRAAGSIEIAAASLSADGDTGGGVSLLSTGRITVFDSVLTTAGNNGDGGPIDVLANGTIFAQALECSADSLGRRAGDIRVGTADTLDERSVVDLYTAVLDASSWEDHTEGASIAVSAPGLISTIFASFEASQTESGPEPAIGGYRTLAAGDFGSIRVLTRDGPLLNYAGFARSDGTQANLAGGTIEYFSEAVDDIVNTIAFFQTAGGGMGGTLLVRSLAGLDNLGTFYESEGANAVVQIESATDMNNDGVFVQSGDRSGSLAGGSGLLSVSAGASMNNLGAFFETDEGFGTLTVTAGTAMDNQGAFFNTDGGDGDLTVTASGAMLNYGAFFQSDEGNGTVTVTSGGLMDNGGAFFQADDGGGILEVSSTAPMNNDGAFFQADDGGGRTTVSCIGDMGIDGAFFAADDDGDLDVSATGDMIGTGATFQSNGVLDGGGRVTISASSIDLTDAAVEAVGDGRCDEENENDPGFNNQSPGGDVSITGAITLAPMAELKDVIRVSGSPVGSSNPAVPDDTDGDMLTDEFESGVPTGPDGDGCGNIEDWDSDGDGFLDTDEGEADADSDGCPNFIEDNFADADDDGDPAHLDPDEGC